MKTITVTLSDLRAAWYDGYKGAGGPEGAAADEAWQEFLTMWVRVRGQDES